MEICEKAENAPGICLLTADSQGPFLDTGFKFNAEVVGVTGVAYIHLPLVKQMGRFVGMVEQEALIEKEERIKDLQAQLEELQTDFQEAEVELQAIRTLERTAGYERKRRPGRPLREEVA